MITANLLTGFLGAGKTSLLTRLLALPELAGTAVLVNEIGEVGLDHLLIEEVDEDVVLLKSGCVCCTIRGDLKDAIVRLHERSQRGRIPAFDRLVIETTGLADPAPVVATLTVDPMLRHHFRMGNVVTVIDAVTGVGNLDAYPEAVRQVASADCLVLSKTDLASAEEVDTLESRLRGLNPTATIRRSDPCLRPEAALLSDDLHDARTRREDVGRWLAHAADAHADPFRHDGIGVFTLEADTPLEWTRFALWLSLLLNRHGQDVLRLKGVVHVTGSDTPVVVQGVQHIIHKPLHLEAWPEGRPATRIVVIARHLDPAAVVRSFRAFNGLAPTASVRSMLSSYS
ncbi:CobW family GTP-binding protein [Marinivivus vitaminiproducens]|uniref:CobW family GTP-binding protein n=1 Tax=Marinivivus vitaminiproducens TaxID=3035935 RepID=UPI0027A06D9D|nr:GTP-binding protein [Geminicoccaceae bacterium SCSIO 64248]